MKLSLKRSKSCESLSAFPLAIIFALAICGCHQSPGGPTAEASGNPAVPAKPADPEADLYKKVRSADVDVDSGMQELNDGLQKAEKLAPRAGGQASSALLSVVEQLNQAGESLADYEDASDTYEEFQKDFKNQDDRRLRCIKVVLDGLAKINDASNVLNDLQQNVPEEFKKDLGAVIQSIDESQTDFENAVTAMGGKIPDDGVIESQDPAQDNGGQDSGTSGRASSKKPASHVKP